MDPFTALGIASVGAMACLGFAALHIVPAGHHAVVTRARAKVRSAGVGVVVAVPGIERVHMVETHPAPIDPLHLLAITRDGVEVQWTLSVLYRVADPALAVVSKGDLRSAAIDAVERTCHHLVGDADFVDLLRNREAMLLELTDQSSTLLEPIGLDLLDVDLLDAEVRVGAQLLRLLS